MNSQRAGARRLFLRALGISTVGMLMLASLAVPQAEAAIGDLHPFAGGIGDGGQAAGAILGAPNGVALAGGVVYIADAKAHRVRKIAADGIITTMAGTGVAGSSGDGGSAADAKIDTPRDLAVDASGNVFIADGVANVVRKVSPAGVISTVAGKGTAGFSGDDGPAVDAELNGPTGLALDSAGNLYIADFGNKRVRKVTADAKITTIAGNGTASWSGDELDAKTLSVDPWDVAVDGTGVFYVSDYSNNRIRKVDTGGVMHTLAGSVCPADLPDPSSSTVPIGDAGPAGAAFLCRPTAMVLDGTGNLIFADTNHQRIRKIEATSPVPLDPARTITTIAGSGVAVTGTDPNFVCPATTQGGSATGVALCMPAGVAVDAAGVVFVSDTLNGFVRKVTLDGNMPTVAGGRFGGDGGPAGVAVLQAPQGVAVDGAGNVYIADTVNNRVRKVTPAGLMSTVAGNGTAGFGGDAAAADQAQLNGPTGLAVSEGGVLFIADTQNDRIRRVDAGGIISTVAGNGTAGFAGDDGPAAAAQLNKPLAVALDALGNVFVADTQNDRIRKVSTAGTIATVAGNGTPGFAGDAAAATAAQINKPGGVAVSGDGLFISDTENHRIRKVDAAGIISSVAGNGSAGCSDGATPAETPLSRPAGIAADVIGQLFIANADCGKVQKIDAAGKIETLAGTGTVGYSGDTGKGTDVMLGRIAAIATDRAGSIFLADQTNHRVRRLEGKPPDSKPPVPTITVVGALAANMTVSFDEAVKSVTEDNVVLRVAGNASNVAASLVCRDEATFVDCATGKVRSVRLDPAASLTPGQTYSTIVNPAGVSTRVTDVAGNPAPSTAKTFRASTVEQESSLGARYIWRTVSASGAFGRSYTVENTPGSTAVVPFVGRSMTWYTQAGPDQGLASVYIDGVFKGTFNQYAGAAKFGVARTFDGLGDTAHRFVLVVRGVKGSRYAKDSMVSIDAIRSAGVLSVTPALWYGWQNIVNSRVSGGRYVQSGFANSAATFVFRGTGLDWYTVTGPSKGIAVVYVDGVLKMTIDNYSRAETYNVRRSVRGLSDAMHTLKIVVAGRKSSASTGTAVAIDRYIVY